METKQTYLRKLWDDEAVMVASNPITLKSNRTSFIYINHRNFICLPDNCRLLIDVLMEVLKDMSKIDFAICNVSSSVSPFLVSSHSIQNNIPYYLLRPDESEKGLIPLHHYISSDREKRDSVSKCFRYDTNRSSVFSKDLPAILIDDVVTTSNTINTAAYHLKNSGVNVIGAAVIVDRRTNSDKKCSIPVHSAFTLRDVIQHALSDPNFESKKKILESELGALDQ